MENDPRALFERMFGTSGSTDPQARLARMKKDRSILDFVSSERRTLKTKLGPEDKRKVEEYSRRHQGRRTAHSDHGKQNSRNVEVIDQPMGIPVNYGDHSKLMMDLLALAYQSDLTRVEHVHDGERGERSSVPGNRRA